MDSGRGPLGGKSGPRRLITTVLLRGDISVLLGTYCTAGGEWIALPPASWDSAPPAFSDRVISSIGWQHEGSLEPPKRRVARSSADYHGHDQQCMDLHA